MITYLDYTAGSTKGGVERGDVYNGVFGLDPQNKFKDGQYTSSKVTVTATGSASATDIALKWTPVVPGSVLVKEDASGTIKYFADILGDGDLYQLKGAITVAEIVDRNGNITVEVTDAQGNTGAALIDTTAGTSGKVGTVNYGRTRDGLTTTSTNGALTGATAGLSGADAVTATGTVGVFGNIAFNASILTASSAVTASCVYNNEYIPQNDVPLINVRMNAIPLIAHARRIAVYFSQMDAFQAKEDYGFDLNEKLAEQAVGQLAYEIDTEGVQLLDKMAGAAAIEWSRVQPVGVSLSEHYEGFNQVLGIAKKVIYDRTKRFYPNFMLIASDLLPILGFLKNWQAAPAGAINGPFFAGSLDGVKVFVTPSLAEGRFIVGVNGTDGMSAAAVYAPYMPIVPTQLLQFADGGTSQGFSTLYDLKPLNKNLVVAGQVRGNVFGMYGTTSELPFVIQQ